MIFLPSIHLERGGLPPLSIAPEVALAGSRVQSGGEPPHSKGLVAQGSQLLLDGKPFVVRSGEMHYPRVPRAYWRDRFRKARAMGLNTICTYVFWNLHEPEQGKFDFSGNLDLAEYLRIAKQEGLKIILRPGPYICTELDFGGLPAWLQKNPTMRVRSQDPEFLAATQRYFDQVGKIVKPYLAENGGNVILTQVENEYGSYGSDHVYMGSIRDALRKAGFSGTLVTSDGPGTSYLSGGTLPGILASVNFGGGAESALAELEKFRPGAPKMVGEYWAGWFDHWGERHHRTSVEGHLKDVEWFLKNGVSFNVYMFHGGTSFAFMPGANGDRKSYQPDITSYDYDSPLDESGRPTPKYFAFRDAIARMTGERLPPIPATPGTMRIPAFPLKSVGGLLGRLPKAITSPRPLPFEALDQAYGMVLYRTRVSDGGRQTLSFDRVADYAMVLVNGTPVGTLDRRRQERQLEVDLPANATLDVLVEAHARINFGHDLALEHEGLMGSVRLGSRELTDWEQYRFPLSEAPGGGTPRLGPQVYRGTFRVDDARDTFLDLGTWAKGYVWVNGHNLGRYWTEAGPQQTLYLPASWLRKGLNEVVVLDEGSLQTHPQMEGLDHPVLDHASVAARRPFRKVGQKLGTLPEPSGGATFVNDKAWESVPLVAEGRYVCLEVRNAYSDKGEGPYASAAELEILGADGKPIKGVKVAYADSEELEADDNSAANLLDGNHDTIWHTEWGSSAPKLPHYVVLDLGEVRPVTALRILPRNDGPNGRPKEVRVYVSRTPFQGL